MTPSLRQYGLIGKTLTHSFSPSYFAKKFAEEGIKNTTYQAFPLATIEDFPKLLESQPKLAGLNVTIPYKEAIIPYLDQFSSQAQAIGAVNTIEFTKEGKLIGHNTDVYGFVSMFLLQAIFKPIRKAKALVLGSGGAAKAICYALATELQVDYKIVSRTPNTEQLSYNELDKDLVDEFRVIINTTPLGMYPKIDAAPLIPYSLLTSKHLLFDLIYNPAETVFMKKGRMQGAEAHNGQLMLEEQANKAWHIWNPSE